MDKSSEIRQRKYKAGQTPERNDTVQLSDLYKQSVERSLSERLTVILKNFYATLAAG